MTSKELFDTNIKTGSDISGHLETLFNIGRESSIVVEFGVRGGCSTSAWLHAGVRSLHCYDKGDLENLPLLTDIAKQNNVTFSFVKANTRDVEIPETDVLFLDTLHNSEQLWFELKHHHKVRQRIVFHDTETNAWVGEDGGGGLKLALINFLLEYPQWRVEKHHIHNNGLTILKRA